MAARQKWSDPKIWAAFLLLGSRIIHLDGAAAGQVSMHLPIEAEFFLDSGNSGNRRRVQLSTRTTVAPGDAIYVAGFNRSEKPVDMFLTYVDSNGKPAHIGTWRLAAGKPFNEGLVVFNDETEGHEAMVAVFQEAHPESDISAFPDISEDRPLSALLAAVGVNGLEALVPITGIMSLTRFGPQREDSLIQVNSLHDAHLLEAGQQGSTNRALGLVSVNVQR